MAAKGHSEMDGIRISNGKSTKNKFKKSFLLKKYIRLHYIFLLKISTRKRGSVACFVVLQNQPRLEGGQRSHRTVLYHLAE